jgi:ATP-binding cassette subfamily C protein CydC
MKKTKLKNELGVFLKLFFRHWKWMAVGAFFGLVTMVAAVGLLSLSGWFISAAAFAGLSVTSAHLFNFFYPSIGVRLLAVLRTAARYVERIVTHDTTFRILESLRSWFYKNLEPLAPARLARYRSGDILSRIVTDIEALDNLYLRALSPTVVAVLMSIIIMIFLWFFNPLIAIVTGVILFIAGVFVSLAALAAGEKFGRQLAKQTADLHIRIVDGLQGVSELVIFGAHHRHTQALGQANRALLKSQLHMSIIKGASAFAVTVLSGSALLIALYLGVGLVNQKALHGANLALIALAVMAAFDAILPLPVAFQFFGRTREAGRRLLEIVDTRPEVNFPDPSATRPERFDLTYENISFRYDEDSLPALSDIQLHVPHGESLAVLGETGAGKSTLANLLVRFWNPAAGRILIGGQDIRDLSESDLRSFICVVSQNAYMFNTTLRKNLLIAKPEASEAELYHALEVVQLSAFVNELPDGLDTWVGEYGKLVSTGQARRLAVARAVLCDAPIWVLDEPTAGLDNVTAQKLMQSLTNLTRNRTVLLISHRLIGLEKTDAIVILEDGRIVEQGTHAELLSGATRYAALQRRKR